MNRKKHYNSPYLDFNHVTFVGYTESCFKIFPGEKMPLENILSGCELITGKCYINSFKFLF